MKYRITLSAVYADFESVDFSIVVPGVGSIFQACQKAKPTLLSLFPGCRFVMNTFNSIKV